MSAAIDCLRAAGLRAIWGMNSRCKAQGITDFSLRARLYRVLATPILTYGAEVWGPSELQSMKGGLTAALCLEEGRRPSGASQPLWCGSLVKRACKPLAGVARACAGHRLPHWRALPLNCCELRARAELTPLRRARPPATHNRGFSGQSHRSRPVGTRMRPSQPPSADCPS